MTRDVHILCEGYQDRDFLSGWFEHVAGWRDPTNGGQRPLTVFAGEKPLKGSHAFEVETCRISLSPIGGRQQLRKTLTQWFAEIQKLESVDYSGIVVGADGDHPPNATTDPVKDLVREALVNAGSTPTGELPWSHREVTIDVISVRAGTVSDIQDLPGRETLERVVATAFARAYPGRYRAMIDWLRRRPDPPAESSKAWTWSIMAGWFAEQGCTDFLRRAIWQDSRMCDELKAVLQVTGLTQVEQRLRTG